MTATTPRAFADDPDGFVRVPVPLRVGVEKDLVVDHAIKFLRELDEVMAAGSMAILKVEPPPPEAS